MRSTIARAAIALVLAAMPGLPGLGAAPASADGVAFPDGHWVASAAVVGGFSSSTQDATVRNGHCGFEMTVAGGRVTGGSFNCDLDVDIVVTVAGTHRATGHAHSEGPMSGTAGSPAVDATTTLTVTASEGGAFGPVSIPGHGTFSADAADCTEATGDLAISARAAQQAAGFASDEQAVFLAIRTDRPPAQADFSAQYAAIVARLQAIRSLDPATADTAALVQQVGSVAGEIDAFQSRVLGAAACPAGAGYSPGTAQHGYFLKMVAGVLDSALKNNPRFSTDQLLSLLADGLRVGAVTGTAADQLNPLSLWGRFEASLESKLGLAETASPRDVNAIYDIYAGAVQAGMAGLAAEARKALGL